MWNNLHKCSYALTFTGSHGMGKEHYRKYSVNEYGGGRGKGLYLLNVYPFFLLTEKNSENLEKEI